MKKIRIRVPAKINYTLEVLDKRFDGFHNIQSIMQTINLYDYLCLTYKDSCAAEIHLSGNSTEIPYDSSNIVYKAALKFFDSIHKSTYNLHVDIEKNIPVSAGLAGGSSDAAGIIIGLNKIWGDILREEEIDKLCASLGSDLNFCLKGGCALCTSRGEVITKLPYLKQKVSLIKPRNIGISAKEAYTKFSLLEDKTNPDNTHKLLQLLLKGKFDKTLLYNSLEKAVINDYEELKFIKDKVKNSVMSGSGSVFFVLSDNVQYSFNKESYFVIENLETINSGVEEI